MGLDAVELVIRVEEEFSIKIEDGEAETTRTMGELHDLVRSKRAAIRQTMSGISCPSQTVFYKLRRYLSQTLHLKDRTLRPSTAFHSLLPRWNSRRFFSRMREELRLAFPLPRSRIQRAISMGCWFAFLGVFCFTLSYGYQWIGLAFLAGILSSVAVAMVGRFLEYFIPSELPGIATLGDLTRATVLLNRDLFEERKNAPEETDFIWKHLCAIVADQLGARPDQLTPQTRFVEDLGLG